MVSKDLFSSPSNILIYYLHVELLNRLQFEMTDRIKTHLEPNIRLLIRFDYTVKLQIIAESQIDACLFYMPGVATGLDT